MTIRDWDTAGRASMRAARHHARALARDALGHLAMVRYYLAMGDTAGAWQFAVHAMDYRRMASNARRRARGDYR